MADGREKTGTNSRREVDPEAAIAVIGSHPRAKILLALLTGDDDYTVTQISERAEIHRSTVHRHIEDLLGSGIITESREAGNSTLYTFNDESTRAQAFAEFARRVTSVRSGVSIE